MIYFVTGDPGSGKSLHCTKLMIDDLVRGDCMVMTNEEMNVPFLRAYVVQLRRKSGNDEPFEMDEHFKLLPKESMFEFWRHRSGELVLESHPDRANADDDEKGKRNRLTKEASNLFMESQFLRLKEKPEFQLPVHYYVAETADFFDAQEWQTTGRAIKWYAQKHRHARDNVYLNTQMPESVESRLRLLCGENIDMVNYARRSIGIFKARPVIKAMHYYKLKSPTKIPFQTTVYEIDIVGVGRCYRTTGALGVHSAPEKNMNRGKLPFWWLWVAGAAGVLLLIAAFTLIPMAGSFIGKKTVSGVTAAINDGSKKILGTPEFQAQNLPADKSNASGFRTPQTFSDPYDAHLSVTGYVLRGSRINISLSDGTTIDESTPGLTNIGRNSVTLNGRVLPLRAAPRPAGGAGVAPVRNRAAGFVDAADSRAQSIESSRDGLGSPPLASGETAPPKNSEWVRDSSGVEHYVVAPSAEGSRTEGVTRRAAERRVPYKAR